MNCIIILILLLVIGTVINYNSNNERFDETGSIFMPLGYHKYGLRGEKLNIRPINDCYWNQYHCYTSTHHPKFTSYDTFRMIPDN